MRPQKKTADAGRPARADALPRPRRRTRPVDVGNAAVEDLVDLGLTLTEARVYVALLETPSASAAEVAARASVARPKVYEALRLLDERGFCTGIATDRITRYRAIPPATALEDWLQHRELERGLRAEQEAEVARRLVTQLRDPRAGQREARFVEYMEAVFGRSQTSEAVQRIAETAEERLLIMHQPPFLQPRTRWNVAEIAALKRGVTARAIYVPETIADEARWVPFVEAGGEVRVLDRVVMKLLLSDHAEAILALRDPITGEQGLTNVIVRHPDLVDALALSFEKEWALAKPVTAPSESA